MFSRRFILKRKFDPWFSDQSKTTLVICNVARWSVRFHCLLPCLFKYLAYKFFRKISNDIALLVIGFLKIYKIFALRKFIHSFHSIIPILTCRKATEALILRASNYLDRLLEMPIYCCPLEIYFILFFLVLLRYD